MILFPAIDMKDGRCVRLKKEEFSTVSKVADSALRTAEAFAEAGAKWVHMVDLDGARDGVRQNFPIIYDVIRQSGLSVELGGGIKSELDVITVGEPGVARIVIGSAAVSKPELGTTPCANTAPTGWRWVSTASTGGCALRAGSGIPVWITWIWPARWRKRGSKP